MPIKRIGTLFLVPLPLSDSDINWSIPLLVIEQISKIQCFIVENAKTSRHFLKKINNKIDWSAIEILELDKHNVSGQKSEIKALFEKYKEIGLMSEAGLPCIADPGNEIVKLAHQLNFNVKPLIGPSSIVLALISSGMNGQSFKFNGYLPAKPEERKKSIAVLEKNCFDTTQLFIETPFRNDAMLGDLLKTLQPKTRLMLAIDISGENELIISRTVSEWIQNPIQIGKVPCMYAIGT